MSTRACKLPVVKRAIPALFFSVVGLGSACVVEQPTGLLSGATGTQSGGSTTSKTSTGATTSSSMSSGTGGTGGMAPVADFKVSIDEPDTTVTLASEVTVTLSIDPKGYSGDVLLGSNSLDGDGLTTSFGKTNLTLDGSTIAKTTFTLKSSSSTPPASVGYTITVASEAGNATASGALTVLPEITIIIPNNVAGLPGDVGNPYTTAFGPYPTVITAPTLIATTPVTVRFYNADTVPHEIHSDQAADGFPHDNMPIQPNSMSNLVRELKKTGTFNYYLHDQGAAQTVGRIVIQ